MTNIGGLSNYHRLKKIEITRAILCVCLSAVCWWLLMVVVVSSFSSSFWFGYCHRITFRHLFNICILIDIIRRHNFDWIFYKIVGFYLHSGLFYFLFSRTWSRMKIINGKKLNNWFGLKYRSFVHFDYVHDIKLQNIFPLKYNEFDGSRIGWSNTNEIPILVRNFLFFIFRCDNNNNCSAARWTSVCGALATFWKPLLSIVRIIAWPQLKLISLRLFYCLTNNYYYYYKHCQQN